MRRPTVAPEPVIVRPAPGEVMQQRGGGKVTVIYSGLRYIRVVDADTGVNSRLVRLADILPVVEAVTTPPKRFANELDREFLSDL